MINFIFVSEPIPMKTKLLLLTLSFCFALLKSSVAQNTFQLEVNYGNNDAFNACLENAQGNYVLAGSIENTGTNFDALFVELSPFGNIVNAVVIASPDFEVVKSIVQTSDGGYFVCGTVFSSPTNMDWMVMKLDASFTVNWYQRIGDAAGDDNANSCFEISPGRYVVVGSAFLDGATKPSIVSFNSSGNIVNEAFLNTNQFASPNYRGKYLGNGLIGINHLSNGLCIVDTMGNVLSNWNQQLGNYSRDVISTGLGRLAVLSSTNSGPISLGVGLSIIDANLNNVVASRVFSDSGDNMDPVQIMEGANQNLFVVANFSSNSSGNYNPLLFRLDSLGGLSTCYNFLPAGSANAQFNAAAKTADGGFLMVGSSGTFGAQHLYVVKTGADGNACNSPTQSLNVSIPAAFSAGVHTPYAATLVSPVPQVSSSLQPSLQTNVLCLVTTVDERSREDVFFKNTTSSEGSFYLSEGFQQNAIIRAYDVSGKLIADQQLEPTSTKIQINLKAGAYLLLVTDADGNILARQKVIRL